MGGGASKTPSSKRVVVLGGGYAGTAAARQLDAFFDVTLVSKSEGFVHRVATLRGAVEAGAEKFCVVPLDKLLKRGTVVTGVEATKIDESSKTVELSNGTSLAYDYLIVATGNLSPKTLGSAAKADTKEAYMTYLKSMQSTIAAANRVLIVGAGAVGLEMAGEIAYYQPSKSVTVVTSKGIMEDPNVTFSAKMKNTLTKQLKKLGVTIVTNAGHVAAPEPNELGVVSGSRTYKWRGGEGEFDLCLLALGGRAVPPVFANSGWDSKLRKDGSLSVDQYLAVAGSSGIWAIGDIAGTNETHLAYSSGIHAALVASNIRALESGKKLKPYKLPTKATGLVTIGPKSGAGQMNGMNLPALMTPMLKGKDMFAKKTFAEANALIPQ